MSDLIDRQAVLDALKEHRALYCDNTPDTFSKLSYAEKSRVDEIDTAIATIVNLPSVENKGEWIPVSERLPEEENKRYWICTDCGYQCECRWTNVNPFWTYLTTDWHWNIMDVPQYSKVVAWMPLPEPYQKGGE